MAPKANNGLLLLWCQCSHPSNRAPACNAIWWYPPMHFATHSQLQCLLLVGVVPQNEWCPRPIMDYSFYGVNAATLPIAPQHAMQFGGTLQCILQHIVNCNRSYGPPLLAKIDLADGYYRVPEAATTALHLVVILPPDGPCQHLVALPLSLPMRWMHSPPYFCVYTKTVTDIANAAPHNQPPHPLLPTTQQHQHPQHPTFHPMAITLPSSSDKPLSYHDIYIDDFITMAQPPVHTQAMNNLLHALNQVFADPVDSPCHAIISVSKMEKGDTAFSSNHSILGWNIDTHGMTLTLPQCRLDKMTSLITTKLEQKYTSVKRWREISGVLRSSSPALYGTIHLFSILQHALRLAKHNRVHLTPLLKAVLREWMYVAHAATQPTPIHTLVPRQPDVLAATDASKDGMGDFWLTWDITSPDTPTCVVWRTPFPDMIQNELVTPANPIGRLTNSDLELVALIVGATLASTTSPRPHPEVLIASDNTAAIAWTTKGSTSCNTAPAYLLHHLPTIRCATPFTLTSVFTPGVTNLLADCCLCSFHLSDLQLLNHLRHLFPHQPSWKIVHPPTDLLLQMNSALCMQLLPLEYQHSATTVTTTPGAYGKPSAETYTVTPNSPKLMTPYPFYKSLHNDIVWASLPWRGCGALWNGGGRPSSHGAGIFHIGMP
jgi:hypothetical protein